MAVTVDRLPTHEQMVQNIMDVYYGANARDRENGRNWYPNTFKYCALVASEFGYPVANVVAAYAIISPSLDKEKNDEQIRIAVECHSLGLEPEDWPPIGVYGMPNRKKAYEALGGDLGMVRGPKVSAFYQNIMGNPHNPTVDRWAIRIAMGNPFLPEADAIPSGAKAHKALADAYISAAKRIRCKPCVVQSITWENMRNTYYAATAPGGKGRGRKFKQLKDDNQYEVIRKAAGIQ